jgi:asparagine synthase (glutamine-hydrolysing)
LKKWVEGDLKDNIFQSLSNNSYSSNFIEQSFIKKLLNKQLDISDEKRAKMLWNMYCLEIWKRNQ